MPRLVEAAVEPPVSPPSSRTRTRDAALCGLPCRTRAAQAWGTGREWWGWNDERSCWGAAPVVPPASQGVVVRREWEALRRLIDPPAARLFVVSPPLTPGPRLPRFRHSRKGVGHPVSFSAENRRRHRPRLLQPVFARPQYATVVVVVTSRRRRRRRRRRPPHNFPSSVRSVSPTLRCRRPSSTAAEHEFAKTFLFRITFLNSSFRFTRYTRAAS